MRIIVTTMSLILTIGNGYVIIQAPRQSAKRLGSGLAGGGFEIFTVEATCSSLRFRIFGLLLFDGTGLRSGGLQGVRFH